MNLFWAGKEYYNKSGTLMGIFYEVLNNGKIKRSGISEIEMELGSGGEVHITQPTEEQLNFLNNKLASIILRG